MTSQATTFAGDTTLTGSLTPDQVAFYHEHGYLHIPCVFDPELTEQLRNDLDWMIQVWANVGVGWTGPWRKQLMDIETEAKSKLIAMHDLHFYSEPWMRCVTQANLTHMMAQLLADPDELRDAQHTPVELHHSTMHVKPSETGHPFPMHQDNAFYEHRDNRFIDVLVHLDDTSHENGEIRFIDGSHRLGYLPHIKRYTDEDGQEKACTPHLDQNTYRLQDTVAVPAKAGDVVIFNILTIHGSHINQTNQLRRMVRVGYRHPQNHQLAGQSVGRPGLMVNGRRPRAEGQVLFPNTRPIDPEANPNSDESFDVKLG